MTLTTIPSPAPEEGGFRPLLLPPGLSVEDYEEAVNREVWAESRDPYLRARALARCERDFYFWARRYCLIQNKATGSETRLLPNAVQLAYERRRGARNVILKQRKPGMSTWIDMRYLWRCLFRPRTNARIVADTHDNSDQLFKRIHFAYDNLPFWMKPKLRRGNVKELYFDSNLSSLQLMTAGSANIGRGSDIDALHCSECAVWKDMASIRAGAGQALRAGAWLDWESTAHGFGEFRDLYIEARDTDIEEVAHFFPWWTDPTYRLPGVTLDDLVLTEKERILVEIRGLDAGQIAWRRMKSKELKETFQQEYPEDDESCFLSTGNPKYDREQLSALLQIVTARVKPLDVRRLVAGNPRLDMLAAQGGALRIWSPPKPGRRYVLGGDPSEGLPTSDPCSIGVLDVTNKAKVDQVAEWEGLLPPHLFGKLMCQLGLFYNRGLLAPERNNHGHAVILEIRRMQRYSRVYSYMDQSQKKGGQEVKFGFPTTEGTKHQMLDLVGRFLTTGEISVRSASFIRQAMAFRSGDEDQRDDSGGHFDTLIAWAIALYVGLNAEPSLAWAGSD